MSVPTRTQDLVQEGVSIWLDDLSRDALQDGTLANLIATRHVSGVTTKPRIFAAALSRARRTRHRSPSSQSVVQRPTRQPWHQCARQLPACGADSNRSPISTGSTSLKRLSPPRPNRWTIEGSTTRATLYARTANLTPREVGDLGSLPSPDGSQ
jgi:hypothetical protein